MTIKTYIVDAFTSTLFGGNQAAVCILAEPKTDSWQQQVAAEFNLSETAFLFSLGENRWSLRWFTPNCEVNICGHATLAAAHVLIQEEKLNVQELVFASRSGDLHARAENNQIKLDFPRIDVTPISNFTAELGCTPIAVYSAGEDLIVELQTANEVRSYEPPIDAIKQLQTRGLIITAPADEQCATGIDFVSRFFAPNAGINEDPVTGSAHCSLASLWREKLGKQTFHAQQLSARGGLLEVVCHETRVELIGSCATFLRGTLS